MVKKKFLFTWLKYDIFYMVKQNTTQDNKKIWGLVTK